MSERKRDYPSGAEKRKSKRKREEVIKKVPKISSFFHRQDTVSDLDWKDSSEARSSSNIHSEIEESQAHTSSDVHPEIEEHQVNDSDIFEDCNIISSDRGNFGDNLSECERKIIFKLGPFKPQGPFPKDSERFIAVTDCSAAGLKTAFLNLTKEYGIDLTKCRGQGYDGANVMSGIYGGLQTLIKEHAPNADYVHCAAHALNLVLNDAARHVREISTFFDNLEKVYTFFGNSIKRWAMLSDDPSEKYLITLKKVCPTRWSSRNDALLAVKKNFLLIMKTLYQLNLISNKKDEREECKNIINILESYDFLVLVTFFSSLFEIINPISKALQHENNDLQKSSILLSNLLNRLCQLRNQISFNSLLNESKDLAKEWGVTTVFKNSRRKITKRFFDELSQDERISDPESYFKVNVYYCCLDILISQTKERFQSLCDLSSMFEILQPEKLLSSSNEEILIASGKLSVKYSKDISVNLCDQLKALKTCLKSEIQKIYSIKELIELLLVKFNSLASSFPEVITACFLFLTLPVTTATAERSFSKLKLIKNYLRTSMGQERLSDLSLLSIEVETLEKLKSSSAINDLINQFAEKKARRMNV
ncbi:unnamed protein product [Acanthoscelides obtectus]|uniref:HAT C-terminal dimerisation domain-containing protein n=1 Tax=Acanthoscelides obtectus TaxID=200917 RepID=A0A9P0M0Q3_ACAOB|nr:unnamed protein product [Acanthoscelides obtectus]CAK1641630.1 Zinc finger MYM-type protein 1 [Acanthoscelides obtectus]